MASTLAIRIGVVLFGLCLPMVASHAQFGAGGGFGLASIGENVNKAGGELEDLLRKDAETLTYDDVSGEVGFYGKSGIKKAFGGLRIAADVGYIYFQNSQIKLTTFSVDEDTNVSATFEVGTNMIPISLGLEYAIPISAVRPYVGAYPTYTFINRTYTVIEGDRVANIENTSAGENEFGLGVEAGIELGFIPSMTLAFSGRYTVANMFSADDNEGTFGLFQLGVGIWFGDLLGVDDEDDE